MMELQRKVADELPPMLNRTMAFEEPKCSSTNLNTVKTVQTRPIICERWQLAREKRIENFGGV